MARGGINKALVKQARDTLLSKGQNPSIDTIRMELGNTGSKTTIHRYLRELEFEEGARLDDESLLSESIKGLVASLAAKLHEEAHSIVSRAEESNEKQLSLLRKRNEEQSHSINTAEQRIKALEDQVSIARQQLADVTEKHQTEFTRNQRFEQQVNDLEKMGADKDLYIQSLEEKHQHSREALEHYRQSAKDQREQDSRRHESQVQQLQAEQRKLQQTLSVKQDELTQLYKDNGRLVSEIGEARKRVAAMETAEQRKGHEVTNLRELLTIESIKLKNSMALLEEKTDQLTGALSSLDQVHKEKHALEIELAKLGAELEVKNRVFEKVGIRE